jgi:hypothetical protein
MAVGEESVIADALKALRKDVKQESTDKLLCGERHGPDTMTVSVILPAKPDLPFID